MFPSSGIQIWHIRTDTNATISIFCNSVGDISWFISTSSYKHAIVIGVFYSTSIPRWYTVGFEKVNNWDQTYCIGYFKSSSPGTTFPSLKTTSLFKLFPLYILPPRRTKEFSNSKFVQFQLTWPTRCLIGWYFVSVHFLRIGSKLIQLVFVKSLLPLPPQRTPPTEVCPYLPFGKRGRVQWALYCMWYNCTSLRPLSVGHSAPSLPEPPAIRTASIVWMIHL